MELVMIALGDPPSGELPASTASRLDEQSWTVAYREHDGLVLGGLGEVPCAALGDLDLDDIVARHAGDAVLVLANAVTVRAYIARVLDVSAHHLSHPAHGSISRVRASRSGQRNLISYSDTLHLPAGRSPSPTKGPECQTSMS